MIRIFGDGLVKTTFDESCFRIPSTTTSFAANRYDDITFCYSRPPHTDLIRTGSLFALSLKFQLNSLPSVFICSHSTACSTPREGSASL